MKDASSVSSKLASDESYSACGKKRKRKNSDQVNILIKYFKKNPRWDRYTVEKASKESGLSRAQVYKWGWDRKKKDLPEEGFMKPSKDEFGGYSKHDFVEANDPIADLLDIDLNEQIKQLELDSFPSETPKKGRKGQLGTPSDSNLVESKRRNLKRERKMKEEVKSSPEKPLNTQPVSQKLVKDAEVQTPLAKRLTEEDFMTPVKSSRLLQMNPKTEAVKAKHNLFADSSEKENDSGARSGSKLIPSSENSFLKNSKSKLNTSDMKCSEELQNRNSGSDENLPVGENKAGFSEKELKNMLYHSRAVEKVNSHILSEKPTPILDENLVRKPFTPLQKLIFYTPEPVIPEEDCLLESDFDPIGAYSVKPLDLDLDFDKHSFEADNLGCIPFDMDKSIEPMEQEESSHEPAKSRFPSFPGLDSEGLDLEDKLYSPRGSFHL
jgi:hypothetical protein